MTSNDFGKTWLVEECLRIDMKNILQKAKEDLKKTLIENQIEMNGVKTRTVISKTGNGGKRYWLVCPRCNKRKGILFQHPASKIIACRMCLGLRYKKCARKGMFGEGLFLPTINKRVK